MDDASLPSPDDQNGPPRLILGIGTSAGGLAALERLLAAPVERSRIAFVIIQHLDPNQESQLARILSRQVRVPVKDATENARVQAGQVYVMPAGKALSIHEGRLRLHDRQPGLRFPIDTFLGSLAKDQEEKAVAVVLTGTGRDGAAGAKDVHDHGGLVIVQDPDEAEFPDMPMNTLATGVVDLVLPLQAIVVRATEYARGILKIPPEKHMPSVLEVLHKRGGPDFTGYRMGTLVRRMLRRISLLGLKDVQEYRELLIKDEEESDRLRRDMLLGVTSFFRDARAFSVVEEEVVARLFAHQEEPVRVWVAGCSTGEEAYSIGMLLLEARERLRLTTRIQVFATDISESAIGAARKGVYDEAELAAVSKERRERFFEPDGAQAYRVKRDLRETIAFAVHDLLSDPPLPAMDLVCCRNLLIYLKPEAQRNVLRSFHFSLRPGGHLFLGASENAGRLDEAFTLVSKDARIYRRTEAPFRPRPVRQPTPAPAPAPSAPPPVQDAEAAREWLLERHAPPAVAVDARRRVITVNGDVADYLGLQRGKASLDVVDMAHKDLRHRLRSALRQAEQQGTPAHARGISTAKGTVDLCVEPVREDLYMVTFHKREAAVPVPAQEDSKDIMLKEMEDELRNTKQRLDETVASSEAANEELRATSEEITSMNEELRTTIEELEASKEELQSLNDELKSVNARLTEETRNAQELSDDLSNLFAGGGIPLLFLDRNLRVRRRTPASDRFFGPSGAGTPITDVRWHFTDHDFAKDARDVLENLTTVAREIRTKDGRRHRRRFLPYRTGDDRIDGVIVVFDDIEGLMKVEDDLRASEAFSAAVVKAVPVPLVVLDGGLRVTTANPAFHALMGFLPGDVEGRSLAGLLGERWDLPPLRELVDGARDSMDGLVLEQQLQRTPFVFNLTARRLPPLDSKTFVLLALQDITSMKQVERDLVSFTSRLHRRVEEQAAMAVEKTRLLERVSYAIGHDLKEPVRAMDSLLTVLERHHRDELSARGQELLLQASDENRRLSGLVRGLLAFSRAIQEDVHRVYPVSVRAALTSEDCRTRFAHLLEERGARLEVEGDARVLASVPAMGYILGNLVQNAILHNPDEAPLVRVQVEHALGDEVEVVVQDNGPGFPPEVVAGLAEKGVATKGFGLSIADQMARFLGGSLRLGSGPQGGGAVHVRLPAAGEPLKESQTRAM